MLESKYTDISPGTISSFFPKNKRLKIQKQELYLLKPKNSLMKNSISNNDYSNSNNDSFNINGINFIHQNQKKLEHQNSNYD